MQAEDEPEEQGEREALPAPEEDAVPEAAMDGAGAAPVVEDGVAVAQNFALPPGTHIYAAPAKLQGDEDAIAIGFDMMSPEQAAKRAARAAKYGEQVDDQVLDKTIQGQKPEIVQFQVDHAKAQARRSKYGDMIEGGDMDTDGGIKEEKKSFDSDVMRRTDTLHVHGTDVLSTEDIIRYFIDYSPQWVEWINDSTCNVKFPEEFSSQRALWACSDHSKNAAAAAAAAAAGAGAAGAAPPGPPGAGADDAAAPSAQGFEGAEKFAWQATPFFQPPGQGVPISLSLRVATVEDKKDSSKLKAKVWKSKKKTVTVKRSDGQEDTVQVLETRVNMGGGTGRGGGRDGGRQQRQRGGDRRGSGGGGMDVDGGGSGGVKKRNRKGKGALELSSASAKLLSAAVSNAVGGAAAPPAAPVQPAVQAPAVDADEIARREKRAARFL